jgi:hypothetical protein
MPERVDGEIVATVSDDGRGGEIGPEGLDGSFVELMDTATAESSPVAERLLAILEQRGWRGWTRIERVPHGMSR